MDITQLDKVAEEIIALRFAPEDTLQQCLDRFYVILRRYGIKQGTPAYNQAGEQVGINCNNYSWTMCWSLFLDTFRNEFVMLSFSAPEDLQV